MQAGEMYKESVRLESANKTAKTRLGIVRQKEKIKQNPGDPAGYESIGKSYLEDGNLNKAIENLKYALGLNASGASLHYNLGTAYFRKKEYKSALEEFKKSLFLNKDLKDKHRIKHYIKIVKMKLGR
jgi:tetratricopeptide (TPR) repeat protein